MKSSPEVRKSVDNRLILILVGGRVVKLLGLKFGHQRYVSLLDQWWESPQGDANVRLSSTR